MEFRELNRRPNPELNKKLSKAYTEFDALTTELKKKEIPDEIVETINWYIEALNSVNGSDREFIRSLRRTRTKTLQLVIKSLKLVPKNYYRNMWMGIGMAAFGIPIGVAFGTSHDNMAFIGIGIPIGLAIGIGIGSGMDANAQKQGRQLDIDVEM